MGMPASRIGDKVAGNVIVSGAATVLIGDAGEGQADKACKSAPAVGSPVNPMLGIKVLPQEVEFSLPAPLPFHFWRSYASDDARIGPLGQGWAVPGVSVSLEVSESATVLVDPQGRRLTFGPLTPGEARFSVSESLWLRRGGSLNPTMQPWGGRWRGVPELRQQDPSCIMACSVGSDLYYIFSPLAGRWRLRSITNRQGFSTDFFWSKQGDLHRVRDSAGRYYIFVYQDVRFPTGPDSVGDACVRLVGVILAGRQDGEESQIRRIDPAHAGHDWLVRYQYDDRGDLVEVRNRLNQPVRSFSYRNHVLVRHAQSGGIDVQYVYDRYEPEGRVLEQVQRDGLTYRFAYSPTQTTVHDSMGRTEEYYFSGLGGLRRLAGKRQADGGIFRYEHDAAGQRVSMTDPLGRVTRYRFDGQGQMIGVQRPDGQVEHWAYDSENGWMTESVDALGRRTKMVRDECGVVRQVIQPGGGVTQYHCDDAAMHGFPTRIVDALGGVRLLTWNHFGQMASWTDCSGQTTRYAYDADGFLCSSTNALNQQTRFVLDPLGRVLSTRLTDGATWSNQRDVLGRVTEVIDPVGQVTRYQYDRWGRPLVETDPQGLACQMRYDPAGRLSTLVNENGAEYLFEYDACDRLIQETGFDGRVRRYQYSLAGEVVCVRDADGSVTRIDRDLLGRVIAVHVPATSAQDADVHRFRYDAEGQLIEASSLGSRVTFAYDDDGSLLTETQRHADGWQYKVRHHHDSLGRQTATEHDGAPMVQWLTYGGAGYLHGVRVGAAGVDIERDALHREVQRRYMKDGAPTWLENTRAYDEVGLLIFQQLRDISSGLWTRTREHDALGRPVGGHDSLSGVLRHGYDGSGRLTHSQIGDRQRVYDYDPAGNRRAGQAPEQVEGASRPITVSDNRVRELEGVTYRYDPAGNVVERVGPDDQRLHLFYDGLHRLVEVRVERGGGRAVVRYGYDPLGRRLFKAVSEAESVSVVTRFGWDRDRMCAEILGQRIRTTLYEPDSFVPMLRLEAALPELTKEAEAVQSLLAECGLSAPGELDASQVSVACYHTDALGTPLMLTDLAGSVLWKAQADDWAAVCHETGDTDQLIRFQGQYLDLETGLYYNRHRYYDPKIGRYLGQDPIGLSGGLNLYTYAGNNSLINVDPRGLVGFVAAAIPYAGSIGSAIASFFAGTGPGVVAGVATGTVVGATVYGVKPGSSSYPQKVDPISPASGAQKLKRDDPNPDCPGGDCEGNNEQKKNKKKVDENNDESLRSKEKIDNIQPDKHGRF